MLFTQGYCSLLKMSLTSIIISLFILKETHTEREKWPFRVTEWVKGSAVSVTQASGSVSVSSVGLLFLLKLSILTLTALHFWNALLYIQGKGNIYHFLFSSEIIPPSLSPSPTPLSPIHQTATKTHSSVHSTNSYYAPPPHQRAVLEKERWSLNLMILIFKELII